MFNHLEGTPPSVAQLDGFRTPIVDGYLRYTDVLYSTMSFPQAGQAVAAPLKFFQGAESTPSDLSLTNVPAGVIPGGQKFYGRKLFLTPLVELTNDADAAPSAAGIIRDLDRILKTNRGFVSYSLPSINKSFGAVPIDAIGEMGGIIPDFGGNNSPSAASHSALNQHIRSAAVGGWPVDLVIYENEQFPFNMTWGVQTAISAATLLRLVILGWRYVKVG